MKLPIYLDYSATTPVDPRVAEKMMQCLTIDGIFGNPASRSHRLDGKLKKRSISLVIRLLILLVLILVKLFSPQGQLKQITWH